MANPPPLEAGYYYHIYNRGNNREDIFREERNYHLFMHLHARHIDPVAETYAWCLLKNHFHWLVRTRELSETLNRLQLRQAFSNCFNAYARTINNAYDRVGSLFQRPFGRIRVVSQAHLLRLVTYIHQNPQKHGFVTDFRDWPWSSFHAYHCGTDLAPQHLAAQDWFGGRRQFLRAHRPIVFTGMEHLAPDDYDGT